MQFTAACLVALGISVVVARGVVCVRLGDVGGREEMESGWGPAIAIIPAYVGERGPGIAMHNMSGVFALGVECPGAWYACEPPAVCGPDGILALSQDEFGPCTAHVYPCCDAVPITDAVAVSIRGADVWSASLAGAVVGPTVGATPAATIAATVSFELAVRASAVSSATVAGVRIGCSARAGHTCRTAVEILAPSGVVSVVEAENPAGTIAHLPPTAVSVWTAEMTGASQAYVAFRATCWNPSAASAYPALAAESVVDAPLSIVAVPTASIATVRVGQAWASSECTNGGCTVDVSGLELGPFDVLGVVQVHIDATLVAGDEQSLAWTAGPVDEVDASFDTTAVVSDTGCARSAAGWYAFAASSPGAMAHIPYPTVVAPGITVLSPGHAGRMVRSSGATSALDAMLSEAVAARLTTLGGAPPSEGLDAAIGEVAEVLAVCPPYDVLVWSAIKYGTVLCANHSEFDLYTLLGTLTRYNNGLANLPACT
jgi:hypothetical protein